MSELNIKGFGKKIKIAGIEGCWGGFKGNKLLLITGIEEGKINYLIFLRNKNTYKTIEGRNYNFKIDLSEKPQDISKRIITEIWTHTSGETYETNSH